MTILDEELPFLERAVGTFARQTDAFSGEVVKDSLGRFYIDDKIVRRAAFYYSQYQEQVEAAELYSESAELPAHIRHAHLLVLRSHLPELCFDEEQLSFDGGEDRLAEREICVEAA